MGEFLAPAMWREASDCSGALVCHLTGLPLRPETEPLCSGDITWPPGAFESVLCIWHGGTSVAALLEPLVPPGLPGLRRSGIGYSFWFPSSGGWGVL